MNEYGKTFKFVKSQASSVKTPAVDTRKLMELALVGNCDEFRDFLILYPDMVNVKEVIHGNVPIHVAASKNNVALIELLIRYGANIDLQDIWGNTALLYAIDKERKESVEILIKHGAKVNLPDFRGNTPLHSACRVGNIDLVQILLKNGADPEAYDYSNMKPAQRSKKYEIKEAIDLEISRRNNKVANTQQVINWMGMGIGLGIGMGVAFAKHQQQLAEVKRSEDDSRRLEELLAESELRKNRHAEMRHQSLASIQAFLNKKI